MQSVLITALVAIVPATAVLGQATPISQARAISDGPSESTGFGWWLGSSSTTDPANGATHSAWQNSTLDSTGATFDLNVSNAYSYLDFVFSLDDWREFELSGSTIFRQGPPYDVTGVATVTLTGPNTHAVAPSWGVWTVRQWGFSGWLGPGTYTLHVTASGSGVFQDGAWRSGGVEVYGGLVFIPTPGAAMTLTLAAAGLMRRRR